jgi:RsiW-degrading membrane proteinase PrsW (M82 family)
LAIAVAYNAWSSSDEPCLFLPLQSIDTSKSRTSLYYSKLSNAIACSRNIEAPVGGLVMTATHSTVALLKPISSSLLKQRSYPLDFKHEIMIGRGKDCQIVLNSDLKDVSRQHVVIRPGAEPGTFEICDLTSRNGTYINGKRLYGRWILQAGDRISLGGAKAEFLFEYPPESNNIPRPAISSKLDSVLPLSQIFPVATKKRDWIKKTHLIPGLILVVFVVALFAANSQNFAHHPTKSMALLNILGICIASFAYYFVYQLCGKSKPFWEIAIAGVTTFIILHSPVWDICATIFRQILPGHLTANSLATLFVSQLFGAGLLEELIKAMPVFLVAIVGRWHGGTRTGVKEPLDGILLGTASATVFTLVETLSQYVPAQINHSDYSAGLLLLIPRILGSIFGHMAYSGYFGYFIGLAMLKPSKRWQLLGIGYFTAATLHALWNTVADFGEIWLVLVGGVSYAFLMAAIAKARMLSPSRSENFATRLFELNPKSERSV